MVTPAAITVLTGAGLLAALVRLAVVDLRSLRLPDALTLPLIAAGLGLAVLGAPGSASPAQAAIGAGLGFAVFWAIGAGFHAMRGLDGLGLGDAKLLAAAGAWLGWQALPLVVLGASVPALIFALVTGRRGRIAFGPWLCLAFGGLWLGRAVLGAP